MNRKLKRIIQAAARIAEFAEAKAKKELYYLRKSGLVSRKEAKALLNAVLREAEQEKRRIKKFIEAELKRELRKAKPLVKKALAKKKKQFEAYRKRRR